MPALRAGVLLALACTAGCSDLIHNDRPDPAALERAIAAAGPPMPLDVALALGCPADDDSGGLSPCEQCRVRSALAAYRRGEVRAIVVSGGPAHNRFIEAATMGAELVRRGVPASAVIEEPGALTTWMNLRLSKRLMRQRGLTTALVISTAAHLPRARRFVEWYGIPARYRACDDEVAAPSAEAAVTPPATSR